MNENIKITDSKKLLSAIGLAANAGKIISGVPLICTALKAGGQKMPLLVIEAGDTSENTHKRISDRCNYYGVRRIRLELDGMSLAHALGKSAPIGAIAVNDGNFCRLIENYLQGEDKN